MPKTPDELYTFLEAHNIAYTHHTHPPVFTVEEARQHTSHLPGGHCKNLFLRDKKKNNYLLVCLDDTAVDLKAFGQTLGVGKLSFGRPERLMEHLGVIPGSVTPLALINDEAHRVKVYLDARMMAYDILNYHPLTNTATTALKKEDLLAFFEATGHNVSVVEL